MNLCERLINLGVDVNICNSVASDSHHVEYLYNRLRSHGIRVWWDKECLKSGLPWEEGLCSGLVDSKTFVCLLSREAINHPAKERQKFSKLEVESPCDNVLLEHQLALQLRSLRLIGNIFPIMIGDIALYPRHRTPIFVALGVAFVC
jgi:hypothetical protein